MRAGVTTWVAVCALGACAEAGSVRTQQDASTRGHDDLGSSTISLSGAVRAFSWALPNAATYMQGVRVCQNEPRVCTETSELGRWSLAGLEPGREIILTYEKPAYQTLYQPIVVPTFSTALSIVSITPDDPDANATEINRARMAAGLPALDTTGLGSIVFSAVTSAGFALDRRVHVRLDPDTGIPPLYSLLSDSSLTTELSDNAMASWAILMNVPPGEEYELEYTMDDGTCTRVPGDTAGWPAKDGRANVTRVPVAEGAVTWMTVQTCVSHDAPQPRQ